MEGETDLTDMEVVVVVVTVEVVATATVDVTAVIAIETDMIVMVPDATVAHPLDIERTVHLRILTTDVLLRIFHLVAVGKI